MTKENSQQVSRLSWHFFSGTLLSRVTGMLRDVMMAFSFGTSPSLAAFLVAFRFVYLIRRLFGEGLLHQGFIPHFEAIRYRDSKKGAQFFVDLFWTLVTFLGILLVFGAIGLSFIDKATAYLALWMLPGIFFICLFGLTTALLQSEKNFFVTSASPALFNLVWIIGILCLKHLPITQAVTGLAITLSIAFFVQWVATLPKVWAFLKQHLCFKDLLRPHIFSLQIRKLLPPLLLGMVGVASIQINSAIDGIFARLADLEGPAYLWYAIRLQQLPLALFGIALSSALLPSLARAFEQKDTDAFFSILNFAKLRIFTLIFPCCIGIFILGLSSVNLLFHRGDFTSHATAQTTLCLWSYGLGLIPAAFVQVLAPAFYAQKNYKIPALGFLFSSLLNIILNSLFVFAFHLGAASIALATSGAAFFNLYFLTNRLGQKIHTLKPFFQVGICTLLAGAIVLVLGRLFAGDATLSLLLRRPLTLSTHFFSQLNQLALQTILYFSLFFAFCKVAKVKVFPLSKNEI